MSAYCWTARYSAGLDADRFQLQQVPEHCQHVYHLYVVRVNGNNIEEREATRNKLQSFLSENGIASGLHYPIPLHLQKCFGDLGHNKGDFPVTEDLAQTGFSLPMFPELKDEQIGYIAEKMHEFFKSS